MQACTARSNPYYSSCVKPLGSHSVHSPRERQDSRRERLRFYLMKILYKSFSRTRVARQGEGGL